MTSEALKPNPTELREIIERLEKLTGGDREVDADIYESLGYTVKRASERITKQYRVTFTKSWAFQDPNTRRWLAMDRLTDSLDAAIALVEKMLPEGFAWMVAHSGPKEDQRLSVACVFQDGPGINIANEATTHAIALLIALFRALEQKP